MCSLLAYFFVKQNFTFFGGDCPGYPGFRYILEGEGDILTLEKLNRLCLLRISNYECCKEGFFSMLLGVETELCDLPLTISCSNYSNES
jgi:hypothetical protein